MKLLESKCYKNRISSSLDLKEYPDHVLIYKENFDNEYVVFKSDNFILRLLKNNNLLKPNQTFYYYIRKYSSGNTVYSVSRFRKTKAEKREIRKAKNEIRKVFKILQRCK